MFRRIISACMAVVLLLTILPYGVFATEENDEAKKYTDFLLSEGYQQLLGTRDKNAIEVNSCLIDLDEDQVDELLLTLTNTDNMGPRGYERISVLLDIQNGEVLVRAEAYYGGGSMGGDDLVIRYDASAKQYRLCLDGYIRDGVSAGFGYLYIYSSDDFTEFDKFERTFYSANGSSYQSEIQKVKNETSLWYEEDYNFVFYQIDGNYVSRAEYDEELSRYVEIDYENLEMYQGTYNSPVKGYTGAGYDETDPLQMFIENCDRRYFSEADISGFSEEDCLIARNAIYAKSGRIFTNSKLKNYFQKYSWYTPLIAADSFTEEILNTYQTANRDLVVEYENKLSGNGLDALQTFIQHCDSRYFTASEISGFTEEDCLYARNAIFAKSGWIFSNQKLASYFQKYSWYKPTVTSDSFTDGMLNKYQIANRDLIVAYEAEGSGSNIDDATYISAVKQAIGGMDWDSGYGALYDIDGNGVAELIMVYTSYMDRSDGQRVPQKVCSLYTMSNDEAICLIDKEVLFTEAGGPSGHASVIRMDGKVYFAITSETGETGGGYCNRYGSWKLYTLRNTEVNLEIKVQYDYYCEDGIDYSNSTATINGQKFIYRDYENWVDALEDVLIVESYRYDPSNYGNGDAMTLHELLEHLKKNPIHQQDKDGPSAEDNSPYEEYARTAWIEQHIEYAASDEYQSEIVGGYSKRMMAVFRDALDDEDINSYETRKAVSSILNLDFELSEADMYELILAEILYGENGQSVTEEAYAQNLEKTVANMTKVLVNIATTGDSAKDIPEDTLKSIKELYELLQTLELGSEEYSTTYGKFISLIKGNVADIKGKVKTELVGDAAFTGLGIVIDGAFEQYEALEDILNYLNNYVAYQSTSRQTHDVLEQLLVVIYKNRGVDGLAGVDKFIDELGLWDSMINWSDFQLATISVIEAMVKYEQEGAAAVAAYAVDREREAASKFGQKAIKSVAVFAIEKAASCVPVINAILLAKNIVSVAVSASVILDQIFTNVDECEYALDILTKSYVISVMLDETVDDCADCMKEDDFYSTTVFDRSVFIYKQNLLNAFGYSVKYADMVLANAEEELREYDKNTNNGKNEGLLDYLLNSREKLIQAVSWYTNSLAILKEQQVDIESIACHDSDLYYDPLTDEIIYNFKDSRIYIVACPVSVVVKNEAGEQIAYLSGESDQVAEGYGFYFHTIKVTADSNEYIKVAIVPDNYQIELVGTDDGTMNAFVADFTTDEVGEVETYFNVPVKKNSVGSFETATDGSDSTALVMDEVVYFNMESSEDIPAETNGNNQWIWFLGGVAVTVIALFLLLRKKNHKA